LSASCFFFFFFFNVRDPPDFYTLLATLPLPDALPISRRPTRYVANSRVVAGRIARCYGRTAPVVHPPVDAARLTAIRRGAPRHYLVVARLLPYKRVDLAIRACARRGAPLVVVGDGPARAGLERLAAGRVRFVGRVDDAQLSALYAEAGALIHAGEEDFGIVPLEANAAGVPVVAFGAGGALETVVDERTGILFDDQTDLALDAALDRVEARRWDVATLRDHAGQFAEPRFHERFAAAALAGTPA
jgi:glycosyltransferase involved in cell wall biosynthesis